VICGESMIEPPNRRGCGGAPPDLLCKNSGRERRNGFGSFNKSNRIGFWRMVSRSLSSQCLRYAEGRAISFELDAGRRVYRHEAPVPAANFVRELRQQLESPLDFPPLELAIVPDDRVVIALARQTPAAAAIIAAVWSVFERRSVRPQDVMILQPASWQPGQLQDPRAELPNSVRDGVRWIVHDATDKSRQRYLASSAAGDRIYLERDVVDADFVLPIGPVGFDPLLGFRSAASAVFPGLSNIDSLAKTRGQDHAELRPEDDRPLRQLQDEVAWLLGVQFGVQVLPSVGDQPAGIVCGALDATTSVAREWLREKWLIERQERCDVVVAALVTNASGATWEDVGAALQSARNLVRRGGKIVLLTNLAAEPTEGFRFLQQSESPRDALKPLRLEAPPDLIPASRLASAADWATVYLVSDLDSSLVESLCMTPLAAAEATRLLELGGSCVLLEAAQHTFAYVA
jgi:nickel-dependent lactate racemase